MRDQNTRRYRRPQLKDELRVAFSLFLLLILILPGCGQVDPQTVENIPAGGEVGEMAPSLTLRSLEGDDVRIESFRGEILILAVWAEICSQCLGAEGDLELIDELNDQYESAESGIHVLAPNFFDPVWRMHEIREEGGYRVKFLSDPDGTFAEAFEINELPTLLTFIVDRSGIIRYRQNRVDFEQIGDVIDRLPD